MLRVTSILDTHAALADEWDDERDVRTVSFGSNYRAAWRCSHGHSWEAVVASRARNGAGCPVCAGQKPEPGVNDLATLRPDLAAEWADTRFSAKDVTAGSNRKVLWRCAEGHEWSAPIVERTSRNTGCTVCRGRSVMPGINDLATLRPELAAEWDDESLAPTAVTVGSNKVIGWRCQHGHTWHAAVASRALKGTGCPVCSGRRVVSDFNDLGTLFPLVAAEWRGGSREPGQLPVSSSEMALWECRRGHTWRARVADRTGGHGCPDCSAMNFSSQFEDDVAGFVADILQGDEVVRNTRQYWSDGLKELDIFVPSLNVAIECNGVYWHSEANGKGRWYHAMKHQAAAALGITLIQVWEDDWAKRRPIVERMLAHKLGCSAEPFVHARKTVASFVSTAEARTFFNAYHIQGWVSATHYLALLHAGMPVAMMALKRTDASGHELRLERFATSARVPGAQSKLIRFAEREIPGWTNLVTFADLEVSAGELYERSGWVHDGDIRPDYKYLVRGERVHKFNYRLARFRSDPSLKYEVGLSERELAALNGLARVWDSGKIRYRYLRGAGKL